MTDFSMTTDFPLANMFVELRSARLAQVRHKTNVMLSAGCSGSHYFRWVNETYPHPIPRHIGVELYRAKPVDLPEGVEWISNSASDMADVPDREVDLLFSGQNIEHLWPDQQVGFFLEAARLIKPGGVLVIDSVNRRVTSAYNWSHWGHTIEFTPAEAIEIMTAAGFDEIQMWGSWLCFDAKTGELLPMDPKNSTPKWNIVQRAVVAENRPEDSFMWWAEAVRGDRPADENAIRKIIERINAKAWPERIQRVFAPNGKVEDRAAGKWVAFADGQPGYLMAGPRMPLNPGRYRAEFDLESSGEGEKTVAACDVWNSQLNKPLGKTYVRGSDFHGGKAKVAVEFEVDEMQFSVQFRVASPGGAAVATRLGVDLIAA